MSGKVVLGAGIAALVGAAIFGAGFWFARRVIPGAVSSEAGLRFLHPREPGRGEGWQEMPFGFGMGEGFGHHGPGERIEAGPMGHMGQGFSGSFEQLTAAQARQAVEAFLTAQGQDGLRVGEILVFENHAYVVVEKESTGTGAFEVLVEPGSHSVHLEFGPAMMWNTEFGMGAMARGMGMPGPMSGLDLADPSVPPGVTADHAVQIAQSYLAETHPGAQLGDTISFPGYYTVHFDSGGTFAGMLSVNAYTGQVWEHTWHGTWVESDE